MKKFFISALLIFGILTSYNGFAQINYGITLGVNSNNVAFDLKKDVADVEINPAIGFHAGGILSFGITPFLGLNTELYFAGKRFEETIIYEDVDGRTADYSEYVNKHWYNYLKLPVNVVFRKRDFRLFMGPYVSAGIFGVVSWDEMHIYYGTDEYNYDGKDFSSPVFGEYDKSELEDYERIFNGIDYGFTGGVGYRYGPFLINAKYSHGLGNIDPEKISYTDDLADIYNRIISISLSYFM